MHRLSRSYPPDKEVLKNVTLAFLPGAKIGVLGYNGAGKSTILRIMAGEDKEYRGDAMLAPDATVGLLEQEPQLDDSKDVRGNVEDGVREVKDMLDRFNELSMNYSEETADEFAALQERIDAVDAWTLDSRLDQAMDALRLPPADADVSRLSGGERRRVALCRLLLRAPDLLLLDEPTNHLDAESVAWLERHLEEYEGTVVAVTHDRYFLDNVTGWILELDRGHGPPVRGQLLQLARAEAGASRARGALGEGPPAHDRRGARLGAPEPEGPPDEAEGAPAQLRGARRRGAQRQARPGPDPHPRRARASARSSSRPRTCARASATGCSSRTCRSPCRAAASSASSAPTAPARRRSSA